MSRTVRGSQAAALAMALVVSACSGEPEGAGETVPETPAERTVVKTPDVVSASADSGSGQPKAFAQCAACHQVNDDAPAGIGPHLVGVFGEPAGSRDDFNYSAALSNSGVVWDEATLDAFLANPQKVAPGTMMAFGGIADAEQRKEVVDYLATLK